MTQLHNNTIDTSQFHLSIGQVEAVLSKRGASVKTHTIRFWLSVFNHIACIKKNGRRYFSEKSVEEIYKIHELSSKGYTLDGVKNLVKYNQIQINKNKDLDEITLNTIELKLNQLLSDLEKLENKISNLQV